MTLCLDSAEKTKVDIHLRIWLSGVAFDYIAAAAAVPHLIHDWTRKRWCTIELICRPTEDGGLLPRLPNERLFVAA